MTDPSMPPPSGQGIIDLSSLVSGVVVNKRPVISVICSIHPPLVIGVYREFSLFLGSFYHEFHEWTNDTNLFLFSIREIRLFVSFVIPNHVISHQHNSSTRRLQLELPESHLLAQEDPVQKGGDELRTARLKCHADLLIIRQCAEKHTSIGCTQRQNSRSCSYKYSLRAGTSIT